jgi:CPA1 family monovalent cation:H+ antiporter
LHEPALVAVAVAGVWAARLLLASLAARRRSDRATIFLAGMRGALPLALALSLPAGLPARPQIIDATYAIVLVTIVAQGALLVPVVGRFYGVKRGAPP